MNSCIFCKIVTGEIPAIKVYEDSICLAFLSIDPINHGHTLLIPKSHHRNWFETSDDILKHLAVQLKKVGIAVKTATNADGINLATNLEKAAGQIVFHTHVHITPRYDNDGFKHWPPKKYDQDEAREIAQKIKEEIEKEEK